MLFKKASSPTRMPSISRAGLPIVANSGVGDFDKLFGEFKVGALIEEFFSMIHINFLTRIMAMEA